MKHTPSKAAKSFRRRRMALHYSRAAGLSVLALAFTVASFFSIKESFETASEINTSDQQLFSQSQRVDMHQGDPPSEEYNSDRAEAGLLMGLGITGVLLTIGSAFGARHYYERGESHRKWIHHYNV